MRAIEVEENPNCSAAELRIFNDLEPPQPVHQIRLEKPPGLFQWFDITGWILDGTICPASIQQVDDSGDGVAFLLFGGDAGLRLKPADDGKPWDLKDSHQWGEPFLLLADLEDIRLKKSV